VICPDRWSGAISHLSLGRWESLHVAAERLHRSQHTSNNFRVVIMARQTSTESWSWMQKGEIDKAASCELGELTTVRADRLSVRDWIWASCRFDFQPVRNQWEYPRKLEEHSPIKPGQPRRRLIPFLFRPFPNSVHKWREVEQGTGLSTWNSKFRLELFGTTARGCPECSRRKERKRTFPFYFQNFRNLRQNAKHPT